MRLSRSGWWRNDLFGSQMKFATESVSPAVVQSSLDGNFPFWVALEDGPCSESHSF